jgi:hypothetical protein
MVTGADGRPGKAPEDFYQVYDGTIDDLQAEREEQLADAQGSGGATLTTLSGAERLQVAWTDVLQH